MKSFFDTDEKEDGYFKVKEPEAQLNRGQGQQFGGQDQQQVGGGQDQEHQMAPPNLNGDVVSL